MRRRFKVPKNWSEKDCIENINKLINESQTRFQKNNYSDAAQMLLIAAQITNEMPIVKARDLIKNKSFKKKKEDIKKVVEPTPQPVQEKTNNPFKV